MDIFSSRDRDTAEEIVQFLEETFDFKEMAMLYIQPKYRDANRMRHYGDVREFVVSKTAKIIHDTHS